MQNQIIHELEAALDETVQLLTTFNDKELNTVPFEGSWTPARVFYHLLSAEDGTDQVLLEPMPVASREPDEGVQALKDIFLDFDTKMESPDFIFPEDREYDREELEGPLQHIKEEMTKAARKVNLAELAPLPEGHPFEGSTKLEILHLMAYHTIRHNHQLKKIRKALS